MPAACILIPSVPYPEVYQAPLYALTIAAGLRLLPHTLRASLFAAAPAPPYGFAADYFLLVLNLAFFWVALWLAFDLGRRLFGASAGWLAAIALFVSVPVWQQVVAVNGTALMMVLALGAFHAWWRVESAADVRGASASLAVLGASLRRALPRGVFGRDPCPCCGRRPSRSVSAPRGGAPSAFSPRVLR